NTNGAEPCRSIERAWARAHGAFDGHPALTGNSATRDLPFDEDHQLALRDVGDELCSAARGELEDRGRGGAVDEGAGAAEDLGHDARDAGADLHFSERPPREIARGTGRRNGLFCGLGFGGRVFELLPGGDAARDELTRALE